MKEVHHISGVPGSSSSGRRTLRIIIAGGGTGGHIFPALAIAHALKKKERGIEIMFVGAKGKMEMEKIPQAGFRIEGIDIAGFNRSSLIKNIGLPFKLLKSFIQVRSILKKFKPDAVIGVGGYSSFPVLRFAQAKGLPTFIHESNSFAGKSNRMLGRKATKIFVATDGMEKFFPAAKILVTGNPVRETITRAAISRNEGVRFFSLNENKKTVLIVGGSLGAKTINETIDQHLDELIHAGLQLIWQTGKHYTGKAKERTKGEKAVWVNEFITQMEYAYAAADIVVARAGAMTVSELSVAKKAVLFVPFPFAAEDHQSANALKLVNKKAALMVKDSEAMDKMIPMILELANDEQKQKGLINNIGLLAITNADQRIADEIIKTLNAPGDGRA